MAAKIQLISAIDLGSDKIKIAVAQQRKNEKTLQVLEIIKENSFGIRKGAIINIDKVANQISKILPKVESTINRKIKEVICNIGGSHLFVTSSKGVVAVSRADQQISQEDVDRVIAAAQAFSLPSNKEILDIFPREFTVNNEKQVKDPLEMKGVRLEAEILAICVFSPYLKNLLSALSLSDIDALDIIPSALASARAILNTRQKELGVAIVDIGAWTTDMAVFEEGELIHLSVFPIGSGHITNDIAIGLKTDIDIAERVKIEFGDCLYQKKGKPEKIEIPSETCPDIKIKILKTGSTSSNKAKERKKPGLIFSRKFLAEIIEARVREIFDQCQKELKKIGKVKLLPAGIVLTGGGSKLKNIENLAKKELELPCQIGIVKGIKDFDQDISLSVIAGLLLKGADLEIENSSSDFNLWSKIKKLLRISLP